MPSIYVGSELMERVQEVKSRLARNWGESEEADVYVSDRAALRELLNEEVRDDLDPLGDTTDGD